MRTSRNLRPTFRSSAFAALPPRRCARAVPMDPLARSWHAKWSTTSSMVGRARAMGLEPEAAERRAIAAFGDPAAIRRQFVTRRMLSDVRAAVRLPNAWWLAIAVDTSAAWIVSFSSHDLEPSSWLARSFEVLSYMVRSGAILWIGHAGLRLGGRWCSHAFSGRSTGGTALAGVGVAVAALGLMLALGPGMVFPMLCDAIDRLLGERSLMAFTALATGSTVAVAGVLRDFADPPAVDGQR